MAKQQNTNTEKAAAKKADTDQAEQKPAKKKSAVTTKAQQLSTVLDAPKPDPKRKEREDDYGRKERQTPKEDINARDDGKDTIYGIAGRARWGGTDTIHELSQDAAEAEASANENEE